MLDKTSEAIFGAYNSYLRGKGYTENQIINFSFKDEKHVVDIKKDVDNKVITLEEGIKLATIVAEGRVETQLNKGEELPKDVVVYHMPVNEVTTKKERLRQTSGKIGTSWEWTALEAFNEEDVERVSEKMGYNMYSLTDMQSYELVQQLGKEGVLPKTDFLDDKSEMDILKNVGYKFKGGNEI